jgi:hypothetical protein
MIVRDQNASNNGSILTAAQTATAFINLAFCSPRLMCHLVFRHQCTAVSNVGRLVRQPQQKRQIIVTRVP